MTIDLEAIKARCDAAVPGPWKWKTRKGKKGARGGWLAAPDCEGPWDAILDDGSARGEYSAFIETGDPNIVFITHAREDIPLLLAEVKRLQADLSELRALVDNRQFYTPGMVEAAMGERDELKVEVQRLRAMMGEGRYYTAETTEAIATERDELKAEEESLAVAYYEHAIEICAAIGVKWQPIDGASPDEAEQYPTIAVEAILRLHEERGELKVELERLWGDNSAPHESGDKCLSCDRLATESAFPYCSQCLLEGQLKVADETIGLLHKQLDAANSELARLRLYRSRHQERLRANSPVLYEEATECQE